MRYTIFKNLVLMLRKSVSLHLRESIASNAKFRTSKGGKISMGQCCSVMENSLLSATGGNIILGNNCFINRNATIVSHSRIQIGSKTSIGPNVCIYDHDHDLYNQGKFICEDVEIGKNVWIGAGVIILKGSKIKDGAVIAAGTVVCGEVEANTLTLDKRNKIFKQLQDRSN